MVRDHFTLVVLAIVLLVVTAAYTALLFHGTDSSRLGDLIGYIAGGITGLALPKLVGGGGGP